MMTLFSVLHEMLALGETIGCERDAGKRASMRTAASLEISRLNDARLSQQPDLAAIREVIVKWKSEVAVAKQAAEGYGIAPVKVGNEKLACIVDIQRAIGDKP